MIMYIIVIIQIIHDILLTKISVAILDAILNFDNNFHILCKSIIYFERQITHVSIGVQASFFYFLFWTQYPVTFPWFYYYFGISQ